MGIVNLKKKNVGKLKLLREELQKFWELLKGLLEVHV